MVAEYNDIRQPSEDYYVKIVHVGFIGRRQYSLPEANEECITLYHTMACTQVRTHCSNMANGSLACQPAFTLISEFAWLLSRVICHRKPADSPSGRVSGVCVPDMVAPQVVLARRCLAWSQAMTGTCTRCSLRVQLWSGQPM